MNIKEALTYDDVLLVPQKSEVTPDEVNIKTKLTKEINLNIPIISAGMDTVTESEMAITLANEGGIGIIHKNMSVENQLNEVKKVKNAQIDKNKYPNLVTDENNRLLVGACIGISNDLDERIKALVESEVDVLVLDSAHGHSKNIINALKDIKSTYKDLQVIAGNIVTKEAALELIEAGADAIKVGVGPGSICTTRVVSGVGVPQLSAVDEVVKAASDYDIPVIADGGIKYSGDIVKALAVGANTVMIGSLLAGCDESPGEKIEYNGKEYKNYRGMGSISAMKDGSKDRYFQNNTKKFVPEGVEAMVEYKGMAKDVIYQMLGGIKSGMGYVGASDLISLYKKAVFVKITGAGLIESHPHDIQMSKDSPNYNKMR